MSLSFQGEIHQIQDNLINNNVSFMNISITKNNNDDNIMIINIPKCYNCNVISSIDVYNKDILNIFVMIPGKYKSKIINKYNTTTTNTTTNNTTNTTTTITQQHKLQNKNNGNNGNNFNEFDEFEIYYKTSSRYNMILLSNNQASINKNIKKNNDIEKILIIDSSNTLYTFKNSYFFIIDNNGIIQYFPDSLEIYNNDTLNNFMTKENIPKMIIKSFNDLFQTYYYYPINFNNNTNITTNPITNPTIKTNTNPITNPNININTNTNINLDNNYSLYNFTSPVITNENKLTNNIESNTQSNTDSTDNNSNSNNTNTNNNSIFYNILQWINPWNYTTTNNIKQDLEIVNQKSANLKQNPAIVIQNNIIKYYLCKEQNNIHIIRYFEDNKNNKKEIKILRPSRINFPLHITQFNIDENNNVICNGTIDDNKSSASITFNKFLLNPIIELSH